MMIIESVTLITCIIACAVAKSSKQWIVFGAGSHKDDLDRWNRYLKQIEPNFNHTVRGISGMCHPSFNQQQCLDGNFNKRLVFDQIGNNSIDVFIFDQCTSYFMQWDVYILQTINSKLKNDGILYIEHNNWLFFPGSEPFRLQPDCDNPFAANLFNLEHDRNNANVYMETGTEFDNKTNAFKFWGNEIKQKFINWGIFYNGLVNVKL
eukprot:325026_1